MPGYASAQAIPSFSADLMLVFNVTPENPAPNTYASISVATTFFDLTTATIAWLENGKLAESGIGKTTHRVLMGKSGSSMVVSAVVKTLDGAIYEKQIAFRPTNVDLIWESPSSAPPFYKGKSLYGLFGQARIIAIPAITGADGKTISPRNILYKWSKNDEPLADHSGYGRNVFLLDTAELRTPIDISADVSTLDNNYRASGKVTLDTAEPLVLLYENSPLYGILFNHAITGMFSLVDKEATIEAFPYFFTVNDRNKLTYDWSVNGATTENFKGPSLTLRKESSEQGSAKVYLNVNNDASLIERGDSEFTISF